MHITVTEGLSSGRQLHLNALEVSGPTALLTTFIRTVTPHQMDTA